MPAKLNELKSLLKDVRELSGQTKQIQKDLNEIKVFWKEPSIVKTLRNSGLLPFVEPFAAEQIAAMATIAKDSVAPATETNHAKERLKRFCENVHHNVHQAYKIMEIENSVHGTSMLDLTGPLAATLSVYFLDRVYPEWEKVPTHIENFLPTLKTISNEEKAEVTSQKHVAGWLTFVFVVSALIDVLDQLDEDCPWTTGVDVGYAGGLALEIDAALIKIWAWKIPIHVLLTALLETVETYIDLK